jgi:hypothetical protein
LAAVAAAAMGLVVSPGLHGNSGEAVVEWTDRATAVLAYFLAAMLATLVARGTVELMRSEVSIGARAGLVAGTVSVMLIIVSGFRDGFRDRLLPQTTVPMAAAAAAITLLAGALAGALGVTLSVPGGIHSGAALWQAMLHTALADAPGIPPTYRLDALATFLVPCSLLLALAVAVQPKQVAAITATMALALVSRGAFDVPLRALCAAVAALWAVLACVDEKAMWRALVEGRKVRLAEDSAPPTAPSA